MVGREALLDVAAGPVVDHERVGVSKSDSFIDWSVLEDCQREVLNEIAPRRIAVLDPLALVIDNWPRGHVEECFAPNHPQKADWGKRMVPMSNELWIEREDFAVVPPKGYFRLFPGNQVRLKYGFVVRCTGYSKDETGRVTEVHCDYLPETKSGTTGAEGVKVKGTIHWVSAAHAYKSEVRLYDRLYKAPHPGRETGNFLDDINPNALTVITAYLEPGLKDAKAGDRFQFERHGYFVADPDSKADALVFNRSLPLRDSWGAPKP